MKSDSELQKLRYDNKELREAADRLADRIEALEADVVKWEEFANDMLDGKNQRIEALEAECFALAANQCRASYGDDYGNRRCRRVETLEVALREIADTPAWGAPERWETTPAEVRQLARDALAPEQDTMSEKITPQPEYDALYAFDAENNIEPASVVAERIAAKYGFDDKHAIVDDIHYAIEDAMEWGQRRGRLLPDRVALAPETGK